MGILSSLFPTPKSIEKGLDALVSSGDKLVFTAEEKAEFSERSRDWALKLYESMQPFNTAMRWLAFGVFFLWGFHLVAMLCLDLLSVLCDADSCSSIDISTRIQQSMKENINEHFHTIMQFYFASALINGAIRTTKSK